MFGEKAEMIYDGVVDRLNKHRHMFLVTRLLLLREDFPRSPHQSLLINSNIPDLPDAVRTNCISKFDRLNLISPEFRQ